MRASNERGLATPAVFIFLSLFVVPLLLVTGLAGEEALLGRKSVLMKRARHLSEFAFWEWLSRSLNRCPGYRPEAAPLFGASHPWVSAPLSGFTDGGRYRCQAVFRTDDGDEDGSPDTPIVLYSRAFGFPSSPFAEGGYPVVDVLAEGFVGSQPAGVLVSVTYTPYLVPRTAALTVLGDLALRGPASVDGAPHGIDGEDHLPDRSGVAGILAGGHVSAGIGVLISEGTGDVPWAGPLEDLGDPYSVLGLPPESRYLEKRLYLDGPSPPWSGTVHFRAGYRGVVDGNGTLIVHNPSFNPRKYLASYRHALGLESPGYDPSYSHLDEANHPAVLEPLGECAFNGVVIADDFGPGFGRLSLRGQMFILNPLTATLGMDGGLEVIYSPEVLDEHVHGDADRVLEWRLTSGSRPR